MMKDSNAITSFNGMKPEQLQKFYNMAEPRSENAIRKAEER